MAKFQNKYRSETARAQWWNYANDGAYFITICTAGREWLFGEILNNEMHLSPIGEMVYQEWNISFDIRAELFCDTFVIMPNHIHAILRIENGVGSHVGSHGVGSHGVGSHGVGSHGVGSHGVGSHGVGSHGVGSHGRATLHNTTIPTQPKTNTGVAYRSPKSISSFVAGFKSAATKRINEFRKTPKMPVWQSRFHDHIIRNNGEYQRIFNYIENNIANWDKDKFFKTEEP